MANLDYIEKRKISQLFNCGGYVLDFTNAKYDQFIKEKTGKNLYAKYGMSKGKNLEAIVSSENDILVGKLLLELLSYMKAIGSVKDSNRSLFSDCVTIGNRLFGKPIVSSSTENKKTTATSLGIDYEVFLDELKLLSGLKDPQSRGFAFEKFLKALFGASNLNPRGAFKIEGEQIDGSFILRDEVYLLEAKWTSRSIDKADLVVFNNKVKSKSNFTRGLFISYSGFTQEALKTFAIGTTVSIFLMTVQELAICLERHSPLPEILWEKARILAEEGDFDRSVCELLS